MVWQGTDINIRVMGYLLALLFFRSIHLVTGTQLVLMYMGCNFMFAFRMINKWYGYQLVEWRIEYILVKMTVTVKEQWRTVSKLWDVTGNSADYPYSWAFCNFDSLSDWCWWFYPSNHMSFLRPCDIFALWPCFVLSSSYDSFTWFCIFSVTK